MKKELLTISLLTAMLLAGCGKVEETKNNTDPTNGQGANAVGTVTGNEDITYIDSLLRVEHRFDMILDREVFEADKDKTDEAASLILEAISQPGTENGMLKEMLCDIPKDDGFMIELKFSQDVGIQVGDMSITGGRIQIIKKDGEYYFAIDSVNEEGIYPPVSYGAATKFDDLYMIRILEALGIDGAGMNEGPITQYYDDILSKLNYVEFYNNGQQDVVFKQGELARILLEGIADTSANEGAIDTDVYCFDLNKAKNEGFIMQVALGEVTDIQCADTSITGNFITLIENRGSYYFEIDTMDMQTMNITVTGCCISIDSSYAEKIMEAAGEGSKPTFEVLTPENIENYQFGFELYNDGHKDCWEKRYDCAKIMLEAIAQPGTDMKSVDLVITPEQHNEMETKGFMTWLKFEEPMDFKVGDTIMTGNTMEIVKMNDSYYFYVGDMDTITCMYEFDSSYVYKILAAAGISVEITGSLEQSDTQTVEEFYKNIDLSKTNMIINTSGKEYTTAGGDPDFISEEQKQDIVMLVLYRLSDTYMKSDVAYLNKENALIDPSGMYMLFDFGQPTDVLVKNLSQSDVYVIALTGNAKDGFAIQVNNAEIYSFDDDIADKIRDILTHEE